METKDQVGCIIAVVTRLVGWLVVSVVTDRPDDGQASQ